MNVLNESTNKLQGTLTFQNYEQKKEFFPLEQAPLLLENEEEEEEEEKKICLSIEILFAKRLSRPFDEERR